MPLLSRTAAEAGAMDGVLLGVDIGVWDSFGCAVGRDWRGRLVHVAQPLLEDNPHPPSRDEARAEGFSPKFPGLGLLQLVWDFHVGGLVQKNGFMRESGLGASLAIMGKTAAMEWGRGSGN